MIHDRVTARPLLRARLRPKHGLLVNDSLVAASALGAGIGALATGDRDFERVAGLTVYRPQDLAGA